MYIIFLFFANPYLCFSLHFSSNSKYNHIKILKAKFMKLKITNKNNIVFIYTSIFTLMQKQKQNKNNFYHKTKPV